MLPQKETNDSSHILLDGYRGNQNSVHRSPETISEHLLEHTSGEKIFPLPHNNQNLFRLAIAALSMGTLIALVVICLLFIGGIGGWISFIVAGCILLGIAITTTNGNGTR